MEAVSGTFFFVVAHMGRPEIICAGGAGSSGGPGVQDFAEGMEKWKMEINGYLGHVSPNIFAGCNLWKSEKRLRKKNELLAGGQWNPGRGPHPLQMLDTRRRLTTSQLKRRGGTQHAKTCQDMILEILSIFLVHTVGARWIELSNIT